jgi:hypothetical protein
MLAGAGAGDDAPVDVTPVAKKAWLRTGKAATYVAAEDWRVDTVVVSVGADGSVRLYDTSGFKFTPVGAFNVGSAYEVTAAALRSARTLLVGFENGTVELWQLPDWRETGTSRQRRAVQIGSSLMHAGRITSFSCTKDLRYFLTSSADSTVVMWNLARFTPVHTFSFSKPAAHALSRGLGGALDEGGDVGEHGGGVGQRRGRWAVLGRWRHPRHRPALYHQLEGRRAGRRRGHTHARCTTRRRRRGGGLARGR